MDKSNPDSDERQISTIPLFGDSEFYLPLKVAERFKFPLAHYIIDKKCVGHIQDWLTGLTGNSDKAEKTWGNFSRAYSKGDTELPQPPSAYIQELPYLARDGKTYPANFASEYLLYALANYLRSTKARPQIAAVKAFLTASGVIVGEMVRDPETVGIKLLKIPDNQTTRKALKEIRRGTDNDLSWEESKERIAARTSVTESHKHVSSVRDRFGVSGRHYADLSNLDFRNGVLVDRDTWKQQHGIKGDALDHLSTVDLVSLAYAKEAAADRYERLKPKTYTEVVEITESLREECERNHRILSRVLPNRFLRESPPKPEQKRLEDQDQ
jgi:hypothetical protein